MSKWDDDAFEDWDMDGEIGDYDRYETLNNNIEACNDKPLPDDFFDDDDDYCDDGEDKEDDFEDIEDLYPDHAPTATRHSEARIYSKTPQAEVKQTPRRDEKLVKVEQQAKAETERQSKAEADKEFDLFAKWFVGIVGIFVLVGITFITAGSGDEVCETIGGIFLGIPIVGIILLSIISRLIG
jgi:hypothetical protein